MTLNPRPEAGMTDLDPALGLPHRRKMQILGAVLLVIFLAALDQTIVGVALPRIVGDLQGTNELYTWAITAYLLAATITGVFYGKLSDIYGRRPMLLFGVSVFLLGSVLCGLSWSMESLIFFRGLQGVGAGAIFPISLAIIGDLFDPRERGRYQGLFGAVFGLASVLGPLLGGWITDNIGWHWIFFVNVPLGLFSLFVVYRLLPTIQNRDRTRKIDVAGAVVFAVGVFFLLLGLTNKATGDWADVEVGGFLLVAAVLTPVFLFIESRAAEPIIPLDLFRNRNYSVSILATFLAAIGFFGAIIFLPRWLQFVQNVSPTESGLQILPLMAGVILGSVGAGILVSRTGTYKWILTGALVLMAVGILLFTNLNAGTEMPFLWLWMFLAGIGIGPTLSVFTIVIQSSVPFTRLGVATGNLTFFRQVGGSVGLAIVGTLFADSFASRLQPSLTEAGVPQEQVTMIASFAGDSGSLGQVSDTTLAQQLGQIPQLQGFVDQIVAGVYNAFSAAIADTFWFGLGATIVALIVVTVALKDLPLRHAGPATATSETAAGTAAAESLPDAT